MIFQVYEVSVFCISGSGCTIDISDIAQPIESPLANALNYLLQTYSRVIHEEKLHPKVNYALDLIRYSNIFS